MEKRQSLIRRIIKATLLVLAATLIFIIAIASLIHLNRDKITAGFLGYLSNKTNAEISFKNVEMSPLAQFPDISITLNKVILKKNFDSALNYNSEHIMDIERLHLAFDIVEMIQGRIDIRKMKFENGQIELVRFKDGDYNIVKAFKSASTDSTETAVKSDTSQSAFSIDLKQVSLNDINIIHTDLSEEKTMKLLLERTSLSFNYLSDSVKCDLDIDMYLGEGLNYGFSDFAENPLNVKSAFFVDLREEHLWVERGAFKYKKAQIDLHGMLEYGSSDVSISFDSKDEDLGLASIFLTSNGLENIEEGSLNVNGRFEGNYAEGIPEFNLSFGAKDFTVKIPNSKNQIKNLNLIGSFYSGKNNDFSSALLRIDTFHADMPDGFLNASLQFQNFTNPSLEYNLNLETSIDKLDEVLDLGNLNELKGRVKIKDQFIGRKKNNIWLDNADSNFLIELDSVSMTFRDSIHLDLIDGKMEGSIDSIIAEKLILNIGETDLNLNGSISNIRDLFFDRGKVIKADLLIEAKHFEFNSIKNFSSAVDLDSNLSLDNLKIDFNFLSTYKKLNDYQITPELRIEIKEVSGYVPDLIPEFNFSDGVFKLRQGPDNSRHLNLEKLKLDFIDSKSRFAFDFFDYKESNDSIMLDWSIKNLSLSNIPVINKNDQSNFNGLIDGNFKISSRQSLDSTINLYSLHFHADSTYYRNAEDTIKIASLFIGAQNIQYDSSSNPLAGLNTNIDISLDKLESTWINKEHLAYAVNVQNGEYHVIPVESSIFGKTGLGEYLISPFADTPRFQFDYVLEDYAVEKFVSSIHKEEFVKGNANLTVHLNSKGTSKKMIFENLGGSIDLHSQDLTLYGFNIDKMLRKYEKTQKFNLLDIGAVALAGPVGLAITKGSSYVNLIAGKYGDSTSITELSSVWSIQNGNFKISDVAFATVENRIAAKGSVDLGADSLNFVVAALDQNGCEIIHQEITGSRSDPKLDGLKIIPKIIAPITNLLSGAVGKDCEVFYDGSVEHPNVNE